MHSTDYPADAFSFEVRIAAALDASVAVFAEVSGLNSTPVASDVGEGGVNRYVHHLPMAPMAHNIVLKRAVLDVSHPLVTWCMQTMNAESGAPVQSRTIVISIADANWCAHQIMELRVGVSGAIPRSEPCAKRANIGDRESRIQLLHSDKCIASNWRCGILMWRVYQNVAKRWAQFPILIRGAAIRYTTLTPGASLTTDSDPTGLYTTLTPGASLTTDSDPTGLYTTLTPGASLTTDSDPTGLYTTLTPGASLTTDSDPTGLHATLTPGASLTTDSDLNGLAPHVSANPGGGTLHPPRGFTLSPTAALAHRILARRTLAVVMLACAACAPSRDAQSQAPPDTAADTLHFPAPSRPVSRIVGPTVDRGGRARSLRRSRARHWFGWRKVRDDRCRHWRWRWLLRRAPLAHRRCERKSDWRRYHASIRRPAAHAYKEGESAQR